MLLGYSKDKVWPVKNILFPFRYEANFKVGYSWSSDLASKLKGQLSIFTTIPDNTLLYFSQLYHELALARAYHMRTVGLPSGRIKDKPVLRNFLKGDFELLFLHFLEEHQFDILVLPEGLLSHQGIRKLVNARRQIISLPDADSYRTRLSDKPQNVFLDTLQRSSCFNLPSSFYRCVSEDKSLFNSIASFFTKKEFAV